MAVGVWEHAWRSAPRAGGRRACIPLRPTTLARTANKRAIGWEKTAGRARLICAGLCRFGLPAVRLLSLSVCVWVLLALAHRV